MPVERKRTSVTLWLILLGVGLFSVMPLVFIVAGSFRSHLAIESGHIYPWQEYTPPATDANKNDPEASKPEPMSLDNYRKIFAELSGLPTYYFNTFYLAVSGTFLTLLVGSLAAYGFAHFKFFGNKAMFALLLLTIMIPGEVCLIGRYELMTHLNLYDKISGLLIAYVAGNLLLVIFIMRNVFLSIPQDLTNAAMIDGASTWQTFWEVMLPIGRNGLAACGILTFLSIWNEFLFALTFTMQDKVRTLPLGIYMLRNQYGLFNTGVLFATVLLSFLPIVVVFVMLQKYFIRGLSAGALKA